MSVILTSSLNLFPGAEATTYLRAESDFMISATFLICEESASEVPPNFATIKSLLKLFKFISVLY